MEDLKIRIDSNLDELIELFCQLGFKYFNHTCSIKNYLICESGKVFFCKLDKNFKASNAKEITIEQLKDMVILNQNDSNDANVHQEGDVPCLYDLYLTNDKELYFYHCGKEKWILSNLNNDEDYYKLLKPIQKEKNVKEFLNPDQGYKLVCCEVGETPIPNSWIKIPDGANSAYFYSGSKSIEFYKKDLYFDGYYLKWFYCDTSTITGDLVWQREKVEVEDKKLDIKKVMGEAEMFDASNREHGHYYKDVSGLNIIDPYMVLKLFNVTDPCLQHIVKKALVAGGRGYKDLERDLKDIHDTSKRALEINNILH